MSNLVRGEIESTVFGRPIKFCLTLGALADIESRYAEKGLRALFARLMNGKLTAFDAITILGAAARGGGETLTNADIAAWPMAGGLDGALKLIAHLIAACLEDPAIVKGRSPHRPAT